ncbi:MAG: response regulator [Campylobacterales bacterium]
MQNALLKSIRVLVIEDDEVVLESVRLLLKNRVLEIDTATNGKDGLRLFMKNRYDVVLTDIYMPSINGVDITKKIKALQNSTIVVLISGNSDAEVFKTAINAGADFYLDKPFENEALLKLLEQSAKKYLGALQAKKENNRLKLVYNSSVHLIMITDGQNILSSNKPLMDFVGMERIRDTDSFINSFVKPPSLTLKKQKNWLSKIKELGLPEVSLRNKTGRISNFVLKIDKLTPKKELFLVALVDITEYDFKFKDSKKEQKQVMLKNRGTLFNDAIIEMVSKEIYRQQRYKAPFCLIRVTAEIKEKQGQIVETKSISSSIEKIISNAIRPTDVVEKIKEGDYVIFTTHTEKSGANALIDRLINDFKDNPKLLNHDINYHFSTNSFKDENSANEFLNHADELHKKAPIVTIGNSQE